MTLSELRADKKIVNAWAVVYNSTAFQNGILKMLQDMHPLRFVETIPVTTASAEKRLGTIEGYEMALERLRLCAQFQPPQGQMPEASFEAPKQEQE